MDTHRSEIETKITSILVRQFLIQTNWNIENPMLIFIKLHKESGPTEQRHLQQLDLQLNHNLILQ